MSDYLTQHCAEYPKRLYQDGHWMDVFCEEDEAIAKNSGWEEKTSE